MRNKCVPIARRSSFPCWGTRGGGGMVQAYSAGWPPIRPSWGLPIWHGVGVPPWQAASIPIHPSPRSRSSRSNGRIPVGALSFRSLVFRLLPASQFCTGGWSCMAVHCGGKGTKCCLVTFQSLIPINWYPILSPYQKIVSTSFQNSNIYQVPGMGTLGF